MDIDEGLMVNVCVVLHSKSNVTLTSNMYQNGASVSG